MVITDQLVRRHPSLNEGWLSRTRSDLVRAGTLYAVALELSLGDHVLLGKGEELTGGRSKPSILADAVEALIGAVHLDGGIDASRRIVIGLFADRLDALDGAHGDSGGAPTDHKSRLQEVCAQGGGKPPTYTYDESGPEHDKRFVAEVHFGDDRSASGEGRSKKQAEQVAAARALDELGVGQSTSPLLEIAVPDEVKSA